MGNEMLGVSPAVSGQHYKYGPTQDFDVQPERPVVYESAVEPYYFIKVVDLSIAVQLPKAGYSGFHAQPTMMARLVEFDLVRGRRSGAH